ncbi:mandelate racemase/muconate lactonizing enzyme family protein [Kineococcus radiotolerans]|uniref:Mandelate racemase/muconate lactonizing protein n=1 Tax=Kineococcus radiotolerans (strain ATCC BAA-149 / DSM 14245 / SRS30216) TaxID=266940 RepID=A6WA68_KINRD|nr:mandelate racemase/muconate lactonizing enzyme family protein [Kineococcus radiotolerans]ABS03707.1 Mandelate racemase/muconate lactonizing protein [Kineococcus radiotolerans SRS30216 = ATCC BAA-149]
MTAIDRIETLRRGPVLAVRVTTADGAVGIGQAAPYQVECTEQVLHAMVAPSFLGTDPADVEAVTRQCFREHYKFLGSFFNRAVAGVETAVWDLLGQLSARPVHQLLGGTVRTRVPVYLSSMVRDRGPQEELAHLQALIERDGFTGVKIRIGTPMGADVDQWPGRTEQLIKSMRDGLGDELSIRADANGGYSAAEAVRVGRMLEEHGYFHFEEPCPYPQIEQTGSVAQALDIPIAGGEQDTSLEQFARILQHGFLDIVQPDIGYLGGVGRAREVAAMADVFGVPCTPHCANHSLLEVFTLHLAAAMPACGQAQEWSAEDVAWARDVYEPALEVIDGHVSLPTGPGWGVRLTERFTQEAVRAVSPATT